MAMMPTGMMEMDTERKISWGVGPPPALPCSWGFQWGSGALETMPAPTAEGLQGAEQPIPARLPRGWGHQGLCFWREQEASGWGAACPLEASPPQENSCPLLWSL